jgi:hypothetical protein
MPGIPEQPREITFPLKGVDVTQELQQQPAETCVDADNVRGVDEQGRARGGSRPGIDRYAPQGGQGANLIQHLNYIVDPSVAALELNFHEPGPDWIEDPNIPGLFYPPGGSGDTPNPDIEQPEDEPETCDIQHYEFEYKAGFAALEADPGTASPSVCECDGSLISWGGQDDQDPDVIFSDVATYNQFLVDNGFIGEGADAVDSVTKVVDDPDGCTSG